MIPVNDKCGLLNDDILIKTNDTFVNGGLLNDDILIKTKWYINGGLLNDDILIKTKWYLCQWSFIEWWYFD